MKRAFLAFNLLFVLLLIGCPEYRPSLVGKWERVGDDAAGTIVQVEKADKRHIGKLVVVSGRLKLIGFQVGEIKWADLEYVGENRWEGLDSTKVFSPPLLYENAIFTIYDNGRRLRVEPFSQNSADSAQKWKRVE